ncbi:MAG: hypothetical protein VW524_12015, partial [Halieaceae bacterium]
IASPFGGFEYAAEIARQNMRESHNGCMTRILSFGNFGNALSVFTISGATSITARFKLDVTEHAIANNPSAIRQVSTKH